jgi:hypothetical protein
MRRILKPGASVVLGLVDRDSPVGRRYLERREESVFYRAAEFYSVEDLVGFLRRAYFQLFDFSQTLFGLPEATPLRIR